jgi:hypothetical protein
VVEFLRARGFRVIEEDREDDHVFLIRSEFDYPVVVPCYDLLNRKELIEIMSNAQVPLAEYRHLL